MFFGNMLNAIFSTSSLGEYEFLQNIVEFLNEAIVPFTVTLTVAAGVFSIVLAFMVMRAESAEKSEEFKKRMKGLLITVVVIIAAVWLLGVLLSHFGEIMSAIRGMGSEITNIEGFISV